MRENIHSAKEERTNCLFVVIDSVWCFVREPSVELKDNEAAASIRPSKL